MTNQTRHFLLTPEGGVREFTGEMAAMVASGNRALPEFATCRVRYLQVTVVAEGEEDVRVQTAGACIGFDEAGKLKEALPPSRDDEQISRFEHDACVQWALRELPSVSPTFH